MKAHHPYRRPSVRRTLTALFPAAVFSIFATFASAQDTQKDYTYFVGAQLFVPTDGTRLPVMDCSDVAVQVVKNGSLQNLPMGDVSSFWLSLVERISDQRAEVDSMTLTPCNHVEFTGMRQFAVNDRKASRISWQEFTQEAASMESTVAQFALNSPLSPPAPQTPDSDPASSVNDPESPNYVPPPEPQQDSSYYLQTPAGGTDTVAGDGSGYDALKIEFNVTPREPLKSAFAVVAVAVRAEANQKPDFWIWVEPLGDLPARPNKVSFVRTGLPPGFVLAGRQLYLFADGREVATSMSQKQYALSKADARYLLNFEYVNANAGKTKGAAPMTELVPSDVQSRLAQAGNPELQLKISADGDVADVAGADRLSADLLGDVKAIPFYPALRDGKPVDSSCRLRLHMVSIPQPL